MALDANNIPTLTFSFTRPFVEGGQSELLAGTPLGPGLGLGLGLLETTVVPEDLTELSYRDTMFWKELETLVLFLAGVCAVSSS